MIDRLAPGADPLFEFGVGLRRGTRLQFLGAVGIEARLGENIATHLDAGDQRVEVAPLGQVVGVDQRRSLGVAAAQPDGAGALGPQRTDVQAITVLVQLGAAVIHHQHGQEMELDVGRRQTRTRAQEAARLGDRRGAGSLLAHHVLEQGGQFVGGVVGVARFAELQQRRVEMVLQVVADAGKIVHWRDAE